MKQIVKALKFFFFPVLLFACFNAQSSTLFRQFSSFTTVSGIVSDGSNLWIATSGGAVKYSLASGAKKVFTDLTDLPDLNLVGVVQDRSGIIWFGSAEGYLIRLDPATESFTSFNALAAAGWPITCILFFKDNIFIGTPNGLSIFSIEKSFIQNVKQLGTFTSVDVSALRSYGDTLAFVTSDGIAYCVSHDVALTIFSDPTLWTCVPATGALGIIHGNGILKPDIFKVLESGTTVWQYGMGNILYKNSNVAGSFPSPVTCLLPLDNNSYVTGTQSSFFWVNNSQKNTSTQVVLDGPNASEMSSCVMDKSGVLWYVPQDPSNGIGLFNGTSWTNLTSSADTALGFLGPGAGIINTIVSTTKDDIWIGTYAYGLKWYNRAHNTWTSYEDPYAALPHLSNVPFAPRWLESPLARLNSDTAAWWTLISGICEDSLGYIWVANDRAYTGAILNVRQPRQNTWRTFPLQDSTLPLLSSNTGPLAAGMDHVSGRQYIYLGYWNIDNQTGNGLTILSYGQTENPLTADLRSVSTTSVQQIPVTDIAVANDTLVWLAAITGIYKVTRNDPATLTKIDKITSSTPILAVTAGYGGKVIFSKDEDLYAYSDGDTSLTRLTTSGALGTNVSSIFLDKNTTAYWIASNKGLFRFESGDSTKAFAGSSAIDVYPNPISRKQLSNGHFIRFAGLNYANPGIRIFDEGGALVVNCMETNTKLVNWNGCNQSGHVVVPGVYFYQVNAGNGKHCKGKIFILP